MIIENMRENTTESIRGMIVENLDVKNCRERKFRTFVAGL